MAGPIAIDTPDYQRGVVSAQLLLGGGGPIDHSATVGVPPNAETLVVVVPGNTLTATRMGCAGTHTGATYPVIPAYAPSHDYATTFFIDATQTVDTEVKISGVEPGEQAWFVYADSGVHIVTDASGATTGVGQRYVVPSVPSVYAGDHPPNEMQCTFDFGTTTQVFMGAPGAGLRYRLFTIELSSDNAAGSWEMVASGNVDGPYIHVAGVNATVIPLHPQGYPMPANTGLTVVQDTAGGTWRGTVWHTIETV